MLDLNRNLLSIAVLALSLAAHADDEKEQSAEKPDGDASGKICINSRLVRSFDGLSDQHVFVTESAKKNYLLTMRRRCMGLRDANTIAFKDTTSRICSNGFGNIVYRDHGSRLESCRIGTIESVADKKDAKALVADRKAAKDEARKEAKEE